MCFSNFIYCDINTREIMRLLKPLFLARVFVTDFFFFAGLYVSNKINFQNYFDNKLRHKTSELHIYIYIYIYME